jgi:hypothetical protein
MRNKMNDSYDISEDTFFNICLFLIGIFITITIYLLISTCESFIISFNVSFMEKWSTVFLIVTFLIETLLEICVMPCNIKIMILNRKISRCNDTYNNYKEMINKGYLLESREEYKQKAYFYFSIRQRIITSRMAYRIETKIKNKIMDLKQKRIFSL